MSSLIKIILVLSAAAAIFSCKSKSGKNANTVSDTVRYYQLGNFINEELTEMKRVPYYIKQITEINNKKDTVILDTTDVERMARSFITADISGDKIKTNYQESVVADNTSGYTTITYSTNNDALPVKFLTVYIDPESEKVKRIDVRKIYAANDSSITEQLAWRSGKGFTINMFAQKDTASTTRLTSVSWNE